MPTDDAPAAALTDSEMYGRMICAILDHQLPPGTKLVEDKLASAFGVSRTRVRPVLVRLANEQVVTLTPNRGAAIAQPSEQEAREVFEARRLIEPRLLELFIAKAGPADIQRLQTCIEQEESARVAGDIRRAIRLSGSFHLDIAEQAGHQTLGRMLRELVSRTSLVLMAYSATAAHEREAGRVCGWREHRTLLNAIRLRDVREAAHAMREHLTRLEGELRFPIGSTKLTPDLAQLLGFPA